MEEFGCHFKFGNMILLPIDQRYSTDAMPYMSDVIDNYFSKNKRRKKVLH